MGEGGVYSKQALLISDSLLVNEAFIQTDIVPVRTLSFALKAHRPSRRNNKAKGKCYQVSDISNFLIWLRN